MATPPKQPPVKQSPAPDTLNTTPSESSEADTTEDDTADDEDEWDSGESTMMHCVARSVAAAQRCTAVSVLDDECGDNNSLIGHYERNQSSVQ